MQQLRENVEKHKFVTSRKFEKVLFTIEENSIRLDEVLAKEKINIENAIVTFDTADPALTAPKQS